MTAKQNSKPAKTASKTKAKAKPARPTLVQYSKEPLTSPPADFDPAKHSRLTRAQFATADVYWDWRAVQFLGQSQAATLKARSIRENGGSREERRARKLISQLQELRDTLAASGVQVDLSSLQS